MPRSCLRFPLSGDNPSKGFKPPGGGLFKAADAAQIILLVFRRRGICKRDHVSGMAAPATLDPPTILRQPRRRKTKRKDAICILSHKQAARGGVCSPNKQ